MNKWLGRHLPRQLLQSWTSSNLHLTQRYYNYFHQAEEAEPRTWPRFPIDESTAATRTRRHQKNLSVTLLQSWLSQQRLKLAPSGALCSKHASMPTVFWIQNLRPKNELTMAGFLSRKLVIYTLTLQLFDASLCKFHSLYPTTHSATCSCKKSLKPISASQLHSLYLDTHSATRVGNRCRFHLGESIFRLLQSVTRWNPNHSDEHEDEENGRARH